jgi:two-component system LytT family response regulator
MKTVIVDDELLVREQIKYDLASVPGLSIIGEAKSVSEAIDLIDECKPELLLLDIELSDGLGFEVLEKSNFTGQIIFITAHSDYAIRGFRLGAIDYLLKPLQLSEFEEAYKKAVNSQLTITKEQLSTAGSVLKNNEPEHLIVKTQEGIYVLKHEEILYCKSDSSYTQFDLIDGSKILVSKTLKEFESALENSFFFRCHKSYLVNLREVHRVNKDDTISLRNGKLVQLASRKRDQFLKKLGEL